MDWTFLVWVAIWYAKEGRHYNVAFLCMIKAIFGRKQTRIARV